jgi:hypothetical protein
MDMYRKVLNDWMIWKFYEISMEVYRKVASPKTLANLVALHGVSERVKIGTNSLRLKILHRETT